MPTPQVAFLADLTVALAAAAIGGGLAARLRLNPILGYLAAGIAIGPFTPGYVAHGDVLETLATLGLIFLLFSLGLGFSFPELRSLGVLPLLGNVVVMMLLGALAAGGAHLAGYPHPLTIALVTVVSSTAVGAALLRGWDAEGSRIGRFTLAQLVAQDLVSVALIVIVTAPASALSPAGILVPVLKAVGFVAVALVVGATVLSRFVQRTVAHAESDLMAPAFAGLALVAAWLGYAAGLSFEFGAFVAGAVISEAAGSSVVATVVAPFRAVFVALFFVSVGMLLDPVSVAALALPIAALGVVLIAARVLMWGALARISGLAAGAALLTGLAMASLGEFNVVLIDGAAHAQRLTGTERQLLLGITLLSIIVTVVIGPYAGRATLSAASKEQ